VLHLLLCFRKYSYNSLKLNMDLTEKHSIIGYLSMSIVFSLLTIHPQRIPTPYSMLYSFFWMISRRLNCMCRRFGTPCKFHLHKWCLPMKMELPECPEMATHKIQTPENHQKERIQFSEHGESLKPYSMCSIRFTLNYAFLCK